MLARVRALNPPHQRGTASSYGTNALVHQIAGVTALTAMHAGIAVTMGCQQIAPEK